MVHLHDILAYQYAWRKNNVDKNFFPLLAMDLKHEGWERINKKRILGRLIRLNPLQIPWKVCFRRRPHGISWQFCNLQSDSSCKCSFRGLEHPCYQPFMAYGVWHSHQLSLQALVESISSHDEPSHEHHPIWAFYIVPFTSLSTI